MQVLRSVIAVAAAQGVICITSLLVYWLAGAYFGSDGFAEYALARRTIAVIVPFIALGLGIAATRFLAQSDLPAAERSALFLASVLIAACSTAIVIIIGVFFRRSIAAIIFGSANQLKLVLPMALLSGALVFHLVNYSFFRGTMRFGWASAFEVANVGLIPVTAFYFCSTVSAVILLTALLSFTLSAATITAIVFFWLGSDLPGLRTLPEQAWRLLRLGVPRIPSDIAWSALFAIPSSLAAHYVGLTEAGILAFGFTLLTLATTLIFPVSVIVLPQAVALLASREHLKLRKQIARLFIISAGGGVLLSFALQLSVKYAASRYFGSDLNRSIGTIRAIALAIPAIMVYSSLRGFVDAVHERAVNSINLIICLAILILSFGIIRYWANDLAAIVSSFLIAIHFLAIATVINVFRTLSSLPENPAIPTHTAGTAATVLADQK